MKFIITLLVIAFVMSSLASTKAMDVGVSREDEKVACVVTDLQVCLPALETGRPPSTECCRNLKKQQSCLCDYMKNPSIDKYLKPARKVFHACGMLYPSC
ncbi:PREDICTED: probable non-specific lipid-transfer protein AKCS9 [Camelina sativa]|uniref:Probable non-specific lipid-transfer protein AKCS9 n=1 Tax=Camelina sativa TaxID=90675 RepID=A0ABM0WSJ2_CAMSA|nr:PREDICTED: probable non-specific lipid-transfer protein AKCS9 [Camelina sativa]